MTLTGRDAPPGARPGTSSWEGALRDFEAMLDGYVALSIAAHDTSSESTPPIPGFTPPADLGPLPERLRVQAVELASRARVIEAELGRVRDEKAAQLAAMNRPKPVYDHDRSSGRLDTHG